MTPGLHYGISAKAYHADPCASPSLSSGIARTLLAESPAHAHLAHVRLGGAGKEPTDSMGLGSLVHSLMDDNPEKDWVLGPFDSYKSGEARAWRDKTALSGKIPALQRDLVEAEPIVAALKTKCQLPSCKSEVTGMWKEGDTWCRARYDRLLVTPLKAEVWDWKTSSSDLSDRGIIKTIAKYGYHIQAAFYLRGLAACTRLPASALSFTLVFVATQAPYTVRQVRLSSTFLGEGYRKAGNAISLWAECMASGKWDDPREADVFEAELPQWLEEDLEITL